MSGGASSAQQVFCAIRKEWVAATPEELVRQCLLQQLTGLLGYPSGLLAVEVGLREMPHLRLVRGKLPSRRADILCYKGAAPLLLLECKATALTAKVVKQVTSYNIHVGAPYIAIANQAEQRTGWYDPSKAEYRFRQGLPSFSELAERVS